MRMLYLVRAKCIPAEGTELTNPNDPDQERAAGTGFYANPASVWKLEPVIGKFRGKPGNFTRVWWHNGMVDDVMDTLDETASTWEASMGRSS